MPHSGNQIARHYIHTAYKIEARGITTMQVIKLIVLAHGWHLAYFQKPLLNEPVQGWAYGPCIKSTYERYRHHGCLGVEDNSYFYEKWWWDNHNPFSKDTLELLDSVYRNYVKFSGIQLAVIARPPWEKCGQELKLLSPDGSATQNFIVDDNTQMQHYQSLMESRNAS